MTGQVDVREPFGGGGAFVVVAVKHLEKKRQLKAIRLRRLACECLQISSSPTLRPFGARRAGASPVPAAEACASLCIGLVFGFCRWSYGMQEEDAMTGLVCCCIGGLGFARSMRRSEWTKDWKRLLSILGSHG